MVASQRAFGDSVQHLVGVQEVIRSTNRRVALFLELFHRTDKSLLEQEGCMCSKYVLNSCEAIKANFHSATYPLPQPDTQLCRRGGRLPRPRGELVPQWLIALWHARQLPQTLRLSSVRRAPRISALPLIGPRRPHPLDGRLESST